MTRATSAARAPAAADEIARFLRTGDHDDMSLAWPGQNIFESMRNGDRALRDALVAEVMRRSTGRHPKGQLPAGDLTAFARRRVAPMVEGLFPRAERDAVLGAIAQSVVFLTPDNIEGVLRASGFLHTAWDLAHLYLGSLGAKLLADDAPAIFGLGVETTSYVSLAYFGGNERFADYVVHEAAHVFHNCKRATLGLRETRTREWLLDIDFRKRELFAYGCEALARIRELGRGPAARAALVDEVAKGPMPNDEQVDAVEYVALLREAAPVRNGWKRILAWCAPRPRPAR